MTTPSGERDETRLFAPVSIVRSEGPGGTIYLESGYTLPEPSRCVGDWLVRWADERPETVCVAERDETGGSWKSLTYGQALPRIEELAGWLIATGADADHPVAILSENSIDQWLMAQAAMYVGIPVATVSTAYSLMSADHAKLKAMIELLDPGVIMVSNAQAYAGALSAIEGLHRARIVAGSNAGTLAGAITFDAITFDAITSPGNPGEVAKRFAEVGPDTIARLLFTSGSTGTPKAVINTQRMLTSNQAANFTLWPFLNAIEPVLVDWLPWSHTFGANFTSNLALCGGGSLYIDEGKPAPPLIGKTVRNIKDVRPNLYFNVPRGFDMLAQQMEQDADLRDAFFSMKLIFYAAAALPVSIWDRLIELSVETTGSVTPLVAAWGSTETAPLATHCHFQAETSGNIGVPVPDTSLKLVPNAGKLEVRVKGPNITPGYFKNESMTRKAFDDEGYYIMGDAVRFADPEDPSKGLFFDGRVSEDFKLMSGTWVSVGELRVAGIDALAPVAQDIVVTGHDREEIGFLVFPNEAACRNLAKLAPDAPLDAVLAHPAVIDRVAEGLAALKKKGGGSSRFAARARFLLSPPNPDTGEITDKAYLNQRQILANRQDDVEALYGPEAAHTIAPA